MNWKKAVSVLLVSAMALSVTACGDDSQTGNSGGGDSVAAGTEASGGDAASAGTSGGDAASVDTSNADLVVWTLSDDLKQFAEKYKEETGKHVEVVVTEPENYPTKVQTAIMAGEVEPDVFVGEPQMLQDFYDIGAFADLNELGAQDYADQIVDYVWQVGQDADGIQRAISYQITPAGIYYRRDIAEKVFGTDDPDEIGKYFADYDTILQTAQTLKDAGYRIFASDAEINYFSGDSAWVIDGTLNVDQGRLDYMDLCVELYQQDLTAYASQWATPWYQAMAGEVPILTAENQWGTDDMNIWQGDSQEGIDAFNEQAAAYAEGTTEVFAFGLPSWGVLTLRDHVGETSGKWGVCAGPSYGFGGGTFIGVSANSKRTDEAWEFVKFCTLNEDTANWWIEKSEGDTVSLKAALDAHKDDANEVYGGQHLYSFWLEQAEGIDYSKVTRYDKQIGDYWGEAISAIKTGEASKEDAINEFYDKVESTFPDITVNR